MNICALKKHPLIDLTQLAHIIYIYWMALEQFRERERKEKRTKNNKVKRGVIKIELKSF